MSYQTSVFNNRFDTEIWEFFCHIDDKLWLFTWFEMNKKLGLNAAIINYFLIYIGLAVALTLDVLVARVEFPVKLLSLCHPLRRF